MENVFDLIMSAVLVIMSSVGFGSLFALAIQIGKIAKPEFFSDSSAQNYRLALALLISLFVVFAPMLGLKVGFEQIDSYLLSVSKFGVMLLPLLTWLIDYLSKNFYTSVLKGRAFVGKSYSK